MMLETRPDSVDAIQTIINQLDECFLYGFVGRQYAMLKTLPHIFAGTPLEARLQASVAALTRNEFTEPHFVSLAAARSALQGTLYDLLRGQIRADLGRTSSTDVPQMPTSVQPDPMLDSVRHWLTELALGGFSRLEASTLYSFAPTLASLRANPCTSGISTLLTGFLNEMLVQVPIKDAEQVPLLRWCDLWNTAMLHAANGAEQPTPTLMTGSLYPLGVEMRQHSQSASLVVYAILVSGNTPIFVRQTWSAFKVSAIMGDEMWLLFPEALQLLQSLAMGKSLEVKDLPVLPSGDMLWNDSVAKTGAKYNPLAIALEYCVPGSNLVTPALPPLERHPIQIAEPIALTDYRIEGDCLMTDQQAILIDSHRNPFPPESLAAPAVFGLLRYDAGHWALQPLTVGKANGKYVTTAQTATKLLKKPPKTNTVATLKERATYLLRRARS